MKEREPAAGGFVLSFSPSDQIKATNLCPIHRPGRFCQQVAPRPGQLLPERRAIKANLSLISHPIPLRIGSYPTRSDPTRSDSVLFGPAGPRLV